MTQWTPLFTMVWALWRHRVGLGEEEFARQRTHLESWCDRLLSEERPQPGDVAVRGRPRKQRESLFGCLYEPTNNRGERSLRPAVIARKVSCGNKTEAGKHGFEILASLIQTRFQRGQDAVS